MIASAVVGDLEKPVQPAMTAIALKSVIGMIFMSGFSCMN
jgi:hypothetical protein